MDLNAEQGMTSLCTNDATAVFCSSKMEGCLIGYLSMAQVGNGYFCVGMTSLPADDARQAFFERIAFSELDGISVIPMGVNPQALS